MQIYPNLSELAAKRRVSYAVTFGKFDGLHLGHQALLTTLKAEANYHHAETLVISFLYAQHESQHEAQSETPTKVQTQTQTQTQTDWGVARPYISSKQEREQILANWGIEHLLYLRFDEINTVSYEDFLLKLLEAIDIKVLVGSDKFSIGAGKQGGPKQICEFLATEPAIQQRRIFTRFTRSLTFSKCSQNLLKTDSMSPKKLWNRDKEYDENPIATTQIKQILAVGKVGLAMQLMWMPFSLKGKVISGQGKGRTLGYPTANFFNHEPKVALPPATYLTFVGFQGELYPALTFVGIPSLLREADKITFFGETRLIVESFLLDFTVSMYNIEVQVYFLAFLRENISVTSEQDLQNYISQDVGQAKAFFTDKCYREVLNTTRERIHKVQLLK